MACICATRSCSHTTHNPHPKSEGIQMKPNHEHVRRTAECSQCNLEKTCIEVAAQTCTAVYLCYPCITECRQVLTLVLGREGLVRA